MVVVFLDNVQLEPNGQRVSRPQVRNCWRVPPPEGHGFHWGTFHPAERQSEISDAAAHTLAVASRCLTKSNGWWKNLHITAQFYYKYCGKKLSWSENRLRLCAFDRISKAYSVRAAFLRDNTIRESIKLFMWMAKYEDAPFRPTQINQLLNFAVSYRYKLKFPCCHCFYDKHVTFFLFIFVWFPFPPRSEVRLERKAFLLIFIVPICSQKFIFDSPFHIYKVIPEGQAVSDSFWSIMSNIPHMRFLPLEEKKTTSEQECTVT